MVTIFRGFDEAVVVDVETTGHDPGTDRIVAVAMVRVHFEALQDNPQGLHGETMDVIVNPQCRIPVKAPSYMASQTDMTRIGALQLISWLADEYEDEDS